VNQRRIVSMARATGSSGFLSLMSYARRSIARRPVHRGRTPPARPPRPITQHAPSATA
jgi:hypothetical protein